MKCNYCKKKKEFEEQANDSLISKDLKNDISIILEIDRGKLVLSTENIFMYKKTTWGCREGWVLTSKKINYCPMCGRKLNNLGDDDCE